MCGPSSALKAVNSQIQNFSNQVTSQSSQIFQGASTVFNNIVGSLQGIVNGGPSQQGFSAGQLSAENAAAVNAGATEARNLKGATSSSIASIGGGNTVTNAGEQQNELLGANEKAATDTATAENNIQQADYAQGNENFFKAEQGEEGATNVFNPATSAAGEASSQQKEAFSSQQEMDNQSNWAMNDIMKLGSAAAGVAGGVLTGGATTALGGVLGALKGGKKGKSSGSGSGSGSGS
jgi:hypothetical protein